MELTVSSTRDHGRTLVSAEVELTQAPTALRASTGAVVPCQYDDATSSLSWVLDSPLAAGEERVYETSADDAPGARWHVEEKPDHLNLHAGDDFVTRYTFLGMRRPYFWPVNTSQGSIARGSGSEDHPHHYGLGMAYGGHGEGGGANIWSDWDEEPYGPCGKVIHRAFGSVVGGSVYAEICETLWYLKANGDIITEEQRRVRVWQIDRDEYYFDWESELSAPDDLGTKPFLLAVRLPNAITGDTGNVLNSDGEEGQEAARMHASWCDFSGPLGDGWSGIAFFDHPENPEYPGKFGEYAVNPQMTLTHHAPDYLDDEPLNLRFRCYVHAEKARNSGAGDRYQDYLNPPLVEVG
ncbi:hypothetical protein HN371_26805 [Candidatus Poribacteria bacterium]|jgi:hypothetical protein|nr:hypothetical protein [Candidatus Poribacteria bacterium]MBT5531966.1 hypothetical protein [Candidatus Poribacteria bacterium]MBT5709568.1 hypothetical protein [Candidatus Poribacteria bacterium]MBT7096099.1 hypothetical protein [Candidatus Poribacteria bacterium]MBT7805965.1 hypothetical protein [Candidatus Poribacteria bacterium]